MSLKTVVVSQVFDIHFSISEVAETSLSADRQVQHD